MAALASTSAIFTPSLGKGFSQYAQSLWSFALPAVTGLTLSPLLRPLLELLPPIVLAVPKKKTSHSRKAMRSANKGLKDKTNIVSCPSCGSPKLAHHICASCYSQINRAWKTQQRESSEGATP